MDKKERRNDLFLSIFSIFIELIFPIIALQIIVSTFYDNLKQFDWITYFDFFTQQGIKIFSIIFYALSFLFLVIFMRKYRDNIIKTAIKHDSEGRVKIIFRNWRILKILLFVPLFSVASEVYYLLNRKYIYKFIPKKESNISDIIE